MGTEVLYPQDCIPHGLRSPHAAILPRRKPYKAYTNPNTNTNPRSNVPPNHGAVNPNSNSRPCRKRREVSPKPKDPVIGQVTILKRGESLDGSTSKSFSKEKKRTGGGAVTAGVLSSDGCGDLIVFGTERIGPDPILVPKQVRIGDLRPLSGPFPGMYAGSVCSVSPSPSALPLPTFPVKKGTCAAAAGHVDMSATNDLRRLLRLA